jgi:hypothetical protein
MSEQIQTKKSKSWLWIVIITIAAGGGMGYWKWNEHQKKFKPEAYETQKESLADIEKNNPAKFLKADGDFKKNLLGSKFKIKGTIANTATIANYKDVTLQLKFYSDTKTVIEEREVVVYDFFNANSNKTFDLKVDKPNGSKTVGWSVKTAIAY